MSDTTGIEWATHTASPWFGCTEVSPGCVNCYARQLTLQKGWAGWGDSSPRVRSKGFWKDAYRLNRKAEGAAERPRMFTSLMDWLDHQVPVEWLADFLRVIHECQNLDWLLLTKRPELWRDRMDAVVRLWAGDGSYFRSTARRYSTPEAIAYHDLVCPWLAGTAPPNVWFGITVEDQRRADTRIQHLVQIPARVRWLSVEPLLDMVRLYLPESPISWVVVGGESGPKRRDCGELAIVDVVDQCREAKVPCFVKQDCALKPGQQGRIPAAVWAMKQFPNEH
jgi:protein gp37